MATNSSSIIKTKVLQYEKNGDRSSAYLSEHTMGSGPYQLQEWVHEQKIILKASDSSKSSLRQILFQLVKEPSVQRLQLENGDIDIAEGIPFDQVDALRKNSQIKVAESPTLNANFIYLNNTHKPLDNPKVRQAINYAIDTNGIIQGVLHGKGIRMTGPIPKGLWGENSKLPVYSFNPTKAKQLLSEAGLSKGVTLKLLYSSYKPYWEQEALAIQDNLAKVGITVQPEKLAWATLRDKVDRGDFDLCLGVWSPDFADPYMFMNYMYDSSNHGLAGNRAFYTNPKVDQLLRKAASITDRNQRVQLYFTAQSMIMQDAPYVILFQNITQIPMRKEVEGYRYNPMLENIYNLSAMRKR